MLDGEQAAEGEQRVEEEEDFLNDESYVELDIDFDGEYVEGTK